MIRLPAIPALGLLFCDAARAQKTVDEIHLRATVRDVLLLADFSGKITPVDVDPRFALAVRIESVAPVVKNFPAGAVVLFALHSPAFLFGREVKKGKTYDFSLRREIEQGRVRYFGFRVVKEPD